MPHTLRPWQESRRESECTSEADTKMCTDMEADDMTYSPSSFPSLHCRNAVIMKTFNPFLRCPLSLADSRQPCNSRWCQNKHTDKQAKANTQTHTINRDTRNPHPSLSMLPSPLSLASATLPPIFLELSATSPSWIFIKQNSKQIDFTPAALLHFYLILSLSLRCSLAPPCPYLSFTTPSFPLVVPSWCLSCFLSVFPACFIHSLSFLTLASPLSHPLASCLSFSSFPQASFSCQSWFMLLDLWPWRGLLSVAWWALFWLCVCVCVSHICGPVWVC